MDIEPIRCIEDLTGLRGEWSDLYARALSATPFQRPEWLLPWWRRLGGGEIFSFAVRAGGRLVGLAPLFLHPWNGRRQVTFLGNGVSDHLGFLLDAEHAASATSAILQAIADERERWDLCDLQDLACDSTLCRVAPEAPLAHAVRPQYVCSAIALPSSWEEFHCGLPHGLRRNLRRYGEHFEGLGAITFETVRDVPALPAVFDALVELHRARWESKTGPESGDECGMIRGPAMEEFHREAAIALASRGLVRLHVMRLEQRIISVVYVWVERGRAYSYLGGFDPGLARFSPGALSLEYAIEQSLREGARVFDFLRGEESYKASWGAQKRVTERVLLWHSQAPADLLGAAA